MILFVESTLPSHRITALFHRHKSHLRNQSMKLMPNPVFLISSLTFLCLMTSAAPSYTIKDGPRFPARYTYTAYNLNTKTIESVFIDHINNKAKQITPSTAFYAFPVHSLTNNYRSVLIIVYRISRISTETSIIRPY